MIDKNELLKLLPKLIREDDEIKGAIITALSGVVTTKEDIARIIENSNRQFEAMDRRFEAMDRRFEAMDRRFEALIIQMNKGFEEARKHREDIENNLIVVRETIGELIQNSATKEDIEKANKEILNYLKKQFED